MLQLTRRLSSDGMVSVGGNDYSVPNGTRRVPLDVELTAHEVRILDLGVLLAVHPVLAGRNQRSVLPGHRLRGSAPAKTHREVTTLSPGHTVARRPLAFYQTVAEHMGRKASAASPKATSVRS